MARKAELDDLLLQARITNKLLVAGLKETLKQSELIALLAGTGASAADIASLLDVRPNSVSVAIHRAKKKKS